MIKKIIPFQDYNREYSRDFILFYKNIEWIIYFYIVEAYLYDEDENKLIINGEIFDDGIRHIYFWDEKLLYLHYFNLGDFIEILGKLNKIIKDFCDEDELF